MCDYSIHHVRTRPAKVGDKLVTRQLSYTTRGFAALEDMNVAVCLLPGTELSFTDEVRRQILWPWTKSVIHHKTAIFRQVNLSNPHTHHDALEFPDGEIVLLTYLMEGQQATVLQLPTSAGVKTEQRAGLGTGQLSLTERPQPRDRRVTDPECSGDISQGFA
jgi:hypothetical protein